MAKRGSRLEWNGAKVLARARRAQITGVNRTLSQTVVQAKNNHAWRNQTGILEGSIKIIQFARVAGRGVRGTWGSADVVYALIHELGGTIRPKSAARLAFQVGGEFRSAASVTIPPRPYLRPAADAIYPSLAENIRAAYREGA
jgi:hypothetical protein